MQRLLEIIARPHDVWLTALAVCVCVIGLATALALLAMAPGKGVRAMRTQGVIASVVAGLSVWASHFIALLGFHSEIAFHYSVPEIVGSLVISLIGITSCIVVTRERRGIGWRVASGLIAGISMTAMQAVALMSLRFPGHVAWDPVMAPLFVGLGLALGVVTILLAARRAAWGIPAGAVAGLFAIVAIHIGVMNAATLVMDPTVVMASSGLSAEAAIGWIVAMIAIVVGISAFMIVFGYWSRSQSLDQLREAIEAMSDGLGFYDADDRLMVWNARYFEMNPEVADHLKVGITFEEIVRIGIDKGYYAEAVGREEDWIAERLAARRGLSNSQEQLLGNGRWLRAQDRRTSAGGTVTVCTDITDLKRDARALADARDTAEAANRAKSEFLANMSHEIRTPLNGVIGLAQALARTDLTSDQTEMLDLIQSSGHTLQTLLSDLLDLARVESGRLELADEPFDLTRAVREAAQLYTASAAEKGLQFFVDIDPDAAVWVQGDVVRLKQVLTNLVSNAVKFTSQGFVSLTVTRSARADGVPLLRFTVEDTGVGFDAAARARLFTRFEQADGTITRRFGGTGLGLAICRQLAGMMQGDLDCESEPGGGSAFILTLPMNEVEAQVRTADAALEPTSDDDRRVRVLVADDHPTNRKVVELILGQAAIDLVQVEDGAQALSACRAETFDLILMDMQMPVMDGLTATREIRLHELAMGFAPVPIVMLTANALPDHIAASHAAGADRHLAKPFDAGELLSIVADLTAEPKALAA